MADAHSLALACWPATPTPFRPSPSQASCPALPRFPRGSSPRQLNSAVAVTATVEVTRPCRIGSPFSTRTCQAPPECEHLLAGAPMCRGLRPRTGGLVPAEPVPGHLGPRIESDGPSPAPRRASRPRMGLAVDCVPPAAHRTRRGKLRFCRLLPTAADGVDATGGTGISDIRTDRHDA
ncbi:hypothetical protein DCS_07182 [Drechmeria coniospora]|uniref:Uncharacterized protein n=1 Tax=Drechmeria coniospora TaxID=98403 RepID=A0A151GDQ9_DRECN|nr:hypothetical protein DCS_07182 [Drechmeria coniospora]KYK55220.1 hypothetical protein DCS_07182 [Drechmeria coniospora]